MDQLTFYGGVDEIGGNKILLELNDTNLLLDFGRSYSRYNDFYEEFLNPRSKQLLNDLIELEMIPKKDGLYRKDVLKPLNFSNTVESSNKTRSEDAEQSWKHKIQSYESAKESGEWHLDGVLVSHAHMDHVGDLPLLGPCPIICKNETKSVLKTISDVGSKSGIEDEFFNISRLQSTQVGNGAYFPGKAKITTKSSGDKHEYRRAHRDPTAGTIEIESVTIEGFAVDHSVPGAMASVIHGNGYQILYTGDFRFHGHETDKLRSELNGLRPDIMLCEGTRMDRHEYYGESDVGTELHNKFQKAGDDSLIIIDFDWKDIDRYLTILSAANDVGRELVVDSRLAYLYNRLNQESVYNDGATVFVPPKGSMMYSPNDYLRSKHNLSDIAIDDWERGEISPKHLEEGVTAHEIADNQGKYVLQLGFNMLCHFPDINPNSSSIYIRSSAEPFTESMKLSHDRLTNWLSHYNINDSNSNEPYSVHSSGHASRPEIHSLIEVVRPRTLIPIHTTSGKKFKNPAGTVRRVERGQSLQLQNI